MGTQGLRWGGGGEGAAGNISGRGNSNSLSWALLRGFAWDLPVSRAGVCLCVCVCVCVCVCAQVPSLVGEDPTCCVTWPKKKKRFWPVCPVSQVGTGMESAGGRAQLGRSARLLENRTGSSLGALSGPCPLHLSTAVDTTSCWEHRAGDCSQILSNLKTVSNCRMSITCLL